MYLTSERDLAAEAEGQAHARGERDAFGSR